MRDDETEFRAFVTARWASLVRTAYLVTTDRGIAEDCVQEAMVRVHRNWRRIRRDTSAPAYAHRAVLNAALSWRRRRRIREVPLTDWTGGEPGVEPGVEPRTDGPGPTGLDGVDPVLLAALRSLPPLMRAAVALRYLEDRSEAETARLLGCSPGTVKSSTSRGVAKLRVALATAPVTESVDFANAAATPNASAANGDAS
jgi:RNA polymerase sigma-70 factor (sigma-E family)